LKLFPLSNSITVADNSIVLVFVCTQTIVVVIRDRPTIRMLVNSELLPRSYPISVTLQVATTATRAKLAVPASFDCRQASVVLIRSIVNETVPLPSSQTIAVACHSIVLVFVCTQLAIFATS
jgi:hypothetical protein